MNFRKPFSILCSYQIQGKVQSKENLEQLEERATAASFKMRLDSDLNIGLIATKRREKSDENCGDRDLYMSIGNCKTEQFFPMNLFGFYHLRQEIFECQLEMVKQSRLALLLIPSLSELP